MWDFSKTQISLDRKLSDYSKIRWLMTKLVRNNRLLYRKVQPGAYLHLGCGPNLLKDFVNLDTQWLPGLDLCCDLRRGIPVASGIIGGIYSEHCLEHTSLEAARFILAECHRALMPKSTIRIVVPDIELYARAYVKSLDGVAATFPNEYFVNNTGINRPVALINELFYGPGHQYIYDFQALSTVLSDAGFSAIARCSFRQGSDQRLLVDSAGHESESLYVEATKA